MKVTAKMILPMVLIVLFGILMPFIFILSIYFGITNHDSINTTQSRPLSSSLSIDSTQRLQQQQLQQRNQHDNTIDKAFQKDSIKKASLIPKKSEQSINIYKRIHELFDMGLKDPKTLHNILSTEDIFGVSNIPFSDTSTFTSCPPSQSLVDYEDITNNHNLNMFRNGTPGAFVFFQHLRKAGGTGFCDLATRNMGQKAIPPYYCMPDNVSELLI